MKQLFYWKPLAIIMAFAFIIVSLNSCDEETQDIVEDILEFSTGLTNLEDTASIENDIYLGGGTNETPENTSLLDKFPPIGNQGSYGTCVAWSVGYNLRTFLYKVDNPNANLNSTANQVSAKDLFWSIPDGSKGSSCGGTGFEAAFDVMLNRGVATLSDVPYDELGDCSYNEISGTNAGDYKISSYRQVAVELDVLKSYLAGGRAVAIGAKLGDNFMSWNSDAVLDYDTYNEPNMQHAYHAMTLSGYDDNKGANGAFRVVNSWGPGWGDNGYVWVDYDFFLGNTGEFCFAAFVADTENSDPDEDDDNDPDENTSGMDVMAWELEDTDDPDDSDPRVRDIIYNVFNIGDEAIPSSKNWNILYMYYNAHDANDYGILLYDYYTTECGSYGEDGELNMDNYPSVHQPGISGNWWNNIDVPPDVSVAQALYGSDDSRFAWGYTMPEDVTGEYYLVLYADGYDVLSEPDETNNYFFFTDANGDPLQIENGVITNAPTKSGSGGKLRPSKGDEAPAATAVNSNNKNTYTPAEIRKLIQYQKETGGIERKVQKYLENQEGTKDEKTLYKP